MTDTIRRGRKPGTDKLTDSARRALIEGLRTGTGPVNLKATAMEVGISRPTLMRYIAVEPGLQKALDQRRKTAGRGYVQVKRAPQANPKVVTVPARSRDPLPTGSGATLLAKLWRGVAEDHRWDLERMALSSRPDDSPDSDPGEGARREHLTYAAAQASAFEALADGSLSPDAAQTRLDELPRPAPLHVPDLAREAEERAADEKAAQDFKAIHGYRPSARQLARLRGKPGRSFAPGEWDEQAVFRDFTAAAKKAVQRRKPRKSYPPRPKDAKGHPLVPRGHMAKLLREQEANGLTGQAAKDAALAAALVELAEAVEGKASE